MNTATAPAVLNIKVTDVANVKLVELGLDREKFLRIGVIPGGCSGMTYDAVIDDIMETGDQVVFESGLVRIVTDQFSAAYVDGLSIDYSDDLVQSGFRLTNSRAVKSCGCGASFKTEEPAGAASAPSGGGCGSGGCGSGGCGS
ncbi:MAG: iron-sulfur cluster assembly accessory protein [Verrucomicrobia bacterium]|nr:iron-sulfur cluster assembly accessory protein [Verrucomicrobiota bacterium]